MQLREEFDQLLELAHGARAVVEIGCYHGGTLFLLSDVASDNAILITVDVEMSRARMPLYRSFARRGQRVHPISGDSHNPATVANAERLLGGRPVDVLLIDGDHTYGALRASSTFTILSACAGSGTTSRLPSGLTRTGCGAGSSRAPTG